MTFDTPILLITWKRPKETLRVIDAMKGLKPSKLYISSDGPRLNFPDESKKVNNTREIINNNIENKKTKSITVPFKI